MCNVVHLLCVKSCPANACYELIKKCSITQMSFWKSGELAGCLADLLVDTLVN